MQLQPPRHPFVPPLLSPEGGSHTHRHLEGRGGSVWKHPHWMLWGHLQAIIYSALGETSVCGGRGRIREQTIKMGYGALLPPSPKLRKSEGVANMTIDSLYKRLSTARFLKNGWLSLGLAAWANRVDIMGKFGSTLALRLLPRLCLRTRLQTYKQILCHFSTRTADSLGHLLGTVSFFFFFNWKKKSLECKVKTPFINFKWGKRV